MSSLKRGRTAQIEGEPRSAKRSRTGDVTSSGSRTFIPARSCKPRVLFESHPQSGVGRDFHSLPYPLDKLPKQSWQTLNQGDEEGAICAKCAKPRPSTPHQRKLFLVAERLFWETGATPYSARSQNEIALWAVNAKLDIFDPAVEDEETVPGGKRSREKPSYPFPSDEEAEFAMRIVARAELLTVNSWEVWKAQLDALLNPPPAKASTGPGSAAEPLEISSDEPEPEHAANNNSRTPADNKHQVNAAYKLLQEWSKTDTVLKSIMDGMERKITITKHGAQIFNSKFEDAMRAAPLSSDASEPDVTRAAKGESPAVLASLSTKARREPDFRAHLMAVSKGVATAQTRSLFKSHVMAARRAISETRPPLQDMSPNSIAQKSKGEEKAADDPAPPAMVKKESSYQTLQDFYSLLDRIERTSPMGAKFLEAYAQRLHVETCKDCWFNMNVLPGLEKVAAGPFGTAQAEASVLQQRTSLVTHQPATSPVANPSLAQGYVERYRARHGEDPPPYITQQYAPNVPHRPSVASQNRLLPPSSAPRPTPGQQHYGRLPTDIVFPTPEQLGLPSASRASGRAQNTMQRTHVSPYQSSPAPRSAKKGRR